MSTATCPICGDRFEKDAAWKKTCMPCRKASKRPERRQPDTLLSSKQETAVVAWLAQIGETDEAIIAEALTRCRHDEDARRYFLSRASEGDTDQQTGGEHSPALSDHIDAGLIVRPVVILRDIGGN